MTSAKAIHQRMKEASHDGLSSILTIIGDDHNVHCLTESDLDTWWASLGSVEKADIYEEHLEQHVVAEDGVEPFVYPLPRTKPAVADAMAVHGARITIDQFAEKIAELSKAYPPIPQPAVKENTMPDRLCKCGCGEPAGVKWEYKRGHKPSGKTPPPRHDSCQS